MRNNHFVGGYNMAFMLENKPEVSVKETTSKTDQIDLMIKNKNLHESPEVLEDILNELSLHKFWAKITNSHNFTVIEFLARDRMLNFYEAATAGGFNINVVRCGMVIMALTATLKTDVKVRTFPSANGPIPCFMDTKTLDMDDLELGCMDQVYREEVKKTVSYLFKTRQEVRRMTDTNRLRVYLLDAMRMWVVSKDPLMHAFMINGGNRAKLIDEDTTKRIHLHLEMGFGDPSTYKAPLELTAFNTSWGRIKSHINNIPAIIKNWN